MFVAVIFRKKAPEIAWRLAVGGLPCFPCGKMGMPLSALGGRSSPLSVPARLALLGSPIY
jgi:hypothetical protein